MDQQLSGADSNRVVSSFVPRQLKESGSLLAHAGQPSKPIGSHAVLVWIDIAGFSPMSNRLLNKHQHGIEQLSKILKNHYDPILASVVEAGGQPVLFAGDGVLAAWPCEESALKEKSLQALFCAQQVAAMRASKDDLGHFLQLHVVVAAGKAALTVVQLDNGKRSYTLLGDSLHDLRAATESRRPGEVLMSPNIQSILAGEVAFELLSPHSALLLQTISEPEKSASPTIQDDQIPKDLIRKFMPACVAEDLDEERLRWIDELRPVNIIFIQLLNVLPEQADAPTLLQKSLDLVTPLVASFKGLMGNLWFDEKSANMMVVFGPPTAAHQDNPVRALRAALRIQEALESHFSVSIGVASGNAFCGIIGNESLRQYTVIGDVVNLAARLSQLQLKGVAIEEATQKAVMGSFHLGSPKMLSIKGKDDLIDVWEINAQDEIIQHASPEIPSIGRDQELNLFKSSIAQLGNPSIRHLMLEGESGFGKTKLLQDFRKIAHELDIPVYSSTCDIVEQNIPYYAWRNTLYTLAGTSPQEDPQTLQLKLEALLKPEQLQQSGLFNGILGTRLPESEWTRSLAPSQRAEATHHLLFTLIKQEATKAPFILMFDDVQWMDETSVQLIQQIIQKKIPALVVICSSLGRSAQWIEAGMNSSIQFQALSGLTKAEISDLAQLVLGVKEIPEELTQHLVEVSKGNPFYCIEMTKALLQDKKILIDQEHCKLAQDIELNQLQISETMQSMVRKRIDSIEDGPKLALKVASVSGWRFQEDLVQEVFPIKKEKSLVPQYLFANSQVGLIEKEIEDLHFEYIFHNAIYRNVAYDMILQEQKVSLHRDIASWYEKQFEENLTPYYTRLSYHWEKGEEPLKAASYLEKEAVHLFSNGFAKASVEAGLAALRLLQLDLPTTPQEIGPLIGAAMMRTGAFMQGKKPMDLLQHPQLHDTQIERTIELLLEVGPFAFQSQQIELFALMSVTALDMTLANGNGAKAATVYSMYSAILSGMTGDRLGGYAWSELALALDRQNNHSQYPRVAFVHTWFHQHWAKPFHESLDLSIQAAQVGLQTGDILYGCFNLSGHVVYLTACGMQLSTIQEKSVLHLNMNGKRVMNAAFHCLLELQYAKALAGETESPLSLSDAVCHEERDLASIFATQLGNQIGYYLVARIKLHTQFGDWKGALHWADQTLPLYKAFEGQIAEIDFVQSVGWAALMAAAETQNLDERNGLLQRAEETLKTLQNWKQLCPANFAHKADLLETLYQAVATKQYAEAIPSLQAVQTRLPELDFLSDKALVAEGMLFMHAQAGLDIEEALAHAEQAYLQWGATRKASFLKEKYTSG